MTVIPSSSLWLDENMARIIRMDFRFTNYYNPSHALEVWVKQQPDLSVPTKAYIFRKPNGDAPPNNSNPNNPTPKDEDSSPNATGILLTTFAVFVAVNSAVWGTYYWYKNKPIFQRPPSSGTAPPRTPPTGGGTDPTRSPDEVNIQFQGRADWRRTPNGNRQFVLQLLPGSR